MKSKSMNRVLPQIANPNCICLFKFEAIGFIYHKFEVQTKNGIVIRTYTKIPFQNTKCREVSL
jgi:hypothetical protein